MKYRNTDNISEKITNFTFSELLLWMKKNPTYLHKYKDDIMRRLIQCKVWVTSISQDKDRIIMADTQRLFNTIFGRSEFTKTEYDIINVFANEVVLKGIYPGSDLGAYDLPNPECKAIYSLLFHKENIQKGVMISWGETYEEVTRTALQIIVDMYIPSLDPPELIEKFSKIGITDSINHFGDTQWVIEKFKEETQVHSTNLKEIILLFKIICDIYENEDASFELMKKYHEYRNSIFFIRNETTVIVNRYLKLFNSEEDALDFINCLFSTIGVWRPVDLRNLIEDFLRAFHWKYSEKITIDILKCILNDISDIIWKHEKYNITRENILYIHRELLTKWNAPSNTYRPNNSEISTESFIDVSTPLTTLDNITNTITLEALHKDSPKMNEAEKKIYKAYRTYKDAEEKVDSQITKAVTDLKDLAVGDVRSEIIEGKQFTALGLLKRVLRTVGLFSIGPVKAVIALLVKYALKKKVTESERAKIVMEIDTELEMLEEKIQDARGDNNREAKYAMMRTKKELENAKVRIEYGMEADKKSLSDSKKALNNARATKVV